MSRALVIRSAIFIFGVVPLMVLLDVVGAAANVAGTSLIVYTAVGTCCLGNYLTKHPIEISTRSARR
jgi:hypothetical protein